MNSQEDTNLQNELTPETLGAFWFTNNSLAQRPKLFYHLDYFFDGLLYKHVYNGKTKKADSSSKILFISKSFERPIFLCHMQHSNKQDLYEEMINVFDVLKTMINSRRKVLILNGTSKGYYKYLNLNFPNIEYKNIKIQ